MAGKKTSFIVDTGATFSLLTFYSGSTQDSKLTIKGVSEVSLRPKISPPLLCQFGKSTLIHSFLIMPRCPMALLGRDLLSKLGVFITIAPPRNSLCILHPGLSPSLTPDLLLDLPALDPRVWDTDHPSIAKHHPPVHITLKDPSTIITQQQYSLTPEAHRGLKPITDRLLQASIPIPTHSPHNTPILAVRKGPSSWRLVQGLQKVNEAITVTFPAVPDPYTLLSTIPPTATHFMV